MQNMFAGGFQLNLHSQRLLGMGHTGTGLALDGSSVFFNPGAISFSNPGSILIGSNAVSPQTLFLARTPSIYQAEMDTLLFTPIYFYLTWQRRKHREKGKKLSFGVSVNNPFVGQSAWPDDWKGKFISQEFAINTFFIQPTVSYRVSKTLGIGVGVSYGFASLLSRRALDNAGPDGTDGIAKFSGTGQGVGINAGLFYKPNEQFSLGVSYRSGVRVSINKGFARFEVAESLTEAYPDMGFTTRMNLPSVINIGIGYRPDERWLLAMDLNINGWKSFDSLNFTLDKPIDALENSPTKRGFMNSTTFRIGGEYQVTPKIQMRGGLYYDKSPVPDGFVSPELPDADRIGLSTGIGINVVDKLFIDATYLYEFTGERTAIFEQAVFGGTYQSSSSIIGLGIRYDF